MMYKTFTIFNSLFAERKIYYDMTFKSSIDLFPNGHLTTLNFLFAGYGRLGNLIFEYASVMGIAERTNHTAIFSTEFLPLLYLFPTINITICGSSYIDIVPVRRIKQKGSFNLMFFKRVYTDSTIMK